MAAPSQLSLYNGALSICGERRLAALSDDREARYLLDDAWGRGAVKYCLERAFWNFAVRSVKATATTSTAVTVSFGSSEVYDKPSDWVRTITMASNEAFSNLLTDVSYKDEGGYWFSTINPLYVRYISNGSGFGNDFNLWTEGFARVVESYLAVQIAPHLKKSAVDQAKIEKTHADFLRVAKSTDAMNEGVSFPPEGSWTRARRGGRNRGDRGNPNQLTG